MLKLTLEKGPANLQSPPNPQAAMRENEITVSAQASWSKQTKGVTVCVCVSQFESIVYFLRPLAV